MKLCSDCHKSFADDVEKCPDHGARLKSDPLIATTLGPFRVTGWLGEGGMGMLYSAEHETIHRKAAVKVIKREFLTDETMVSRFAQEARAVAKIGHPHLIDIFDIGTTPDGRLYYIMELLEGKSLAEKMIKRRLNFSEFGPILRDTCEAIEAAHAVGVVHRDLKPDNVYLVERQGEPPFVKVLDFGVAKVLGTDEDVQSKLTRTGNIVGTPQYMSPEQIDGSKVDARTDVYALGVILYELATGALPFKAETLGGMLKAHLMDTPPIFEQTKLSEGVPSELEEVTFKAMAKKRDDRYQSVRELREDLERVLQAKAPEAGRWWREQAASGRSTIDTLPGVIRAELIAQGKTSDRTRPGTPVGMTDDTHATARPTRNTWKYVAVAVLVLSAGPIYAIYSNSQKPTVTVPPVDPNARKLPTKKRGPDLPALKSKALSVIQTAMADGDPAVRRMAIDALTSGRDPRHRTLVEPLLGDADLQVRAAAAACLASLGSRSACAALNASLGKDQNVDVWIAEALVKLGDEAGKKKLREVLKKGDETARFKAALALVQSGDKDARKLLEKRVAGAKPDDQIAVGITAALARSGDREARKTLQSYLMAPDEPIQMAAAEALARLGDEQGRATLTGLAGKEGKSRLLAYRILASLDDQSGYDLFRTTFSDGGKPLPERLLAAQGLGASGEKAALETLAPVLDDSEPALRLGAAGAMLAIVSADPKALAAKSLDWATAALADSSWTVREQAVSMLGDADSKVSVPLLGKALHDDQPEVRRAAAGSLGRTKAPAAVAYLGEALSDKRSDVRMTAIRSMGRVSKETGDQSAKPLLAKHLATASPDEKVVAAGQLVALGDKSHLSELKDGLNSEDPEVRRLAIEAVAADPETEKDAVQAGLKDKSFAVRLASAMQLADKGSKDGVAVLQEAVKKGGAEGLLAYGVLEKLGVKPDSEIDMTALLLAEDPEVRIKAIGASGRLSRDKAIAFLKRALHDPEPRVRSAALTAAAEFTTASANNSWAGLVLLKSLTNDSDPAVRAKAGLLVAKLTPPEPDDDAPATTPTPVPTPSQVQPVQQAQDMTLAAPAAAPDLALAPTPTLTAPADMSAPRPVAVVAQPDMAAAKTVTSTKLPTGDDDKEKEKDNKEEVELAITEGEIALHAGKYETAIRELQRAHRLDAKAPVYFSLGEAYRHMGDRETDPKKQKTAYSQAIANYKRAHDKRAKNYAAELQERLSQ